MPASAAKTEQKGSVGLLAPQNDLRSANPHAGALTSQPSSHHVLCRPAPYTGCSVKSLLHVCKNEHLHVCACASRVADVGMAVVAAGVEKNCNCLLLFGLCSYLALADADARALHPFRYRRTSRASSSSRASCVSSAPRSWAARGLLSARSPAPRHVQPRAASSASFAPPVPSRAFASTSLPLLPTPSNIRFPEHPLRQASHSSQLKNIEEPPLRQASHRCQLKNIRFLELLLRQASHCCLLLRTSRSQSVCFNKPLRQASSGFQSFFFVSPPRVLRVRPVAVPRVLRVPRVASLESSISPCPAQAPRLPRPPHPFAARFASRATGKPIPQNSLCSMKRTR